MSLLLAILFFVSGVIGSIIAVAGETWKKDNKRVTGKGWVAIICLLSSALTGIVKDRMQSGKIDSYQNRLESMTLQLQETEKEFNAATSVLFDIASGSGDERAVKAIDSLFKLNRQSLVRVKAVVGGRLREKTGFFVDASGTILTTDYSVVSRGPYTVASDVRVETSDGSSIPAEISYVDKELEIAILSTGRRSDSFLTVGERAPAVGEEVLVIGSTHEVRETRVKGVIESFSDITGIYVRYRNLLAGFGGGPVLGKDGVVVGINWGALEPPVNGKAKYIRADAVRRKLKELGI